MVKLIYFSTALILLGCLSGNDNARPGFKFIGFGEECGSCNIDGFSSWSIWSLHQTSRMNWQIGRPNNDLIFGKITDQNAGLLGMETRNALQGGLDSIFDAGGHCLTFRQTGVDTIIIDKKKVIVSIPIEPCFHYYLDTLGH